MVAIHQIATALGVAVVVPVVMVDKAMAALCRPTSAALMHVAVDFPANAYSVAIAAILAQSAISTGFPDLLATLAGEFAIPPNPLVTFDRGFHGKTLLFETAINLTTQLYPINKGKQADFLRNFCLLYCIDVYLFDNSPYRYSWE